MLNTMDEDNTVLQYLKTLTLLCVEDNKTTQIIYDSIFEDFVKEIIFADDGIEGYQKYIDNDKIDIIISDYEMPNANGLEMCEKIRINDKDIPIILITAIEDINIIVKALHLGVNTFVKKPLVHTEVLKAVKDVSKLLIANKYLEEERDKKLKEFQKKEIYNSYQEELGFSKELNILRNDFYYQMNTSDGVSLVDFLYKPLDVLSGDAYSARRIDEHITFYLMVDGMGKGLSASLTAMIMTSFVNHLIDKMLATEHFDFSILINESMEFIKPTLLDEESLSIDFILMDYEDNRLCYSKFAMPALLMQNNKNEIVKLKSNNPPLCKWQPTFNIDTIDISEITKFLIYSDGIVENTSKYDDNLYISYIEEDFLNAFTKEDLKNSFFDKVNITEDDITLIFIHRLNSISTELSHKSFDSTLDEIDNANEWYTELWEGITTDISVSYKANVVFTELLMNAYEHGNLGIDSANKHYLLDNDTYFDTLLEKEKNCSKKIDIKVDKIEYGSCVYIITLITDEGVGFDTQMLSEIFRNSQTFNGRGVFVSRKNSSGIYYNSKGNTVLFLNKI
ncbi:MAG: response regulator [Campylobacterota bacterium]|nr:response regulator [Campylobacterota bacterium]